VALVLAVAVTIAERNASKPPAAPAQGLPNTPDYHSLMVSSTDPQHLLLGTHVGIYASNDGGRVWHFQSLGGKDAMNLARPGGATVWMAGHQVMAKSSDGGKTWQSVKPPGLPSYDVHGLAASLYGGTLYAAVAGRGLFRSTNGGTSFSQISADVGGNVMALAIRPDGSIWAGDMQQGLLASRNGGKSWTRLLNAQLMGLAVNPHDPQRIIATGPGILLSTDGGISWRRTLNLAQGAGPVAWAPSEKGLAYVVGFDRSLYRSKDGGITWQPVVAGG
jgi:photosystem II stability/assembly factor-like uncharacterized protein